MAADGDQKDGNVGPDASRFSLRGPVAAGGQLQGDDADENQPRTTERQAAVVMVEELSEGERTTLGADPPKLLAAAV